MIFPRAPIMLLAALTLTGLLEIRSWYVICWGCTLLLHILSFFLEKCVLGVPFLTSVCWVCPVVYCGRWIRCGIFWDSLGVIYTHVCYHRRNGFGLFSYSVLKYVSFFLWASIIFLIFPPSGAVMSTTIPGFLMLSTTFTAVIMLCL